MSKLQNFQANSKQINKTVISLSSYLAKKDNPKQMRIFLENILTESEMIMVARRIQVADMLLSGFTHGEIINKLKVGQTTINNVNSTLKKFLINEKIRKKVFEKDKQRIPGMGNFDYLRKTYKGYFAILNAILD